MEKSAKLILTDTELEQVKSGTVPSTLKRNWGFTDVKEVQEVIDSGQVESELVVSTVAPVAKD